MVRDTPPLRDHRWIGENAAAEFEKWAQAMVKDGEYGDHMMVAAVALVLGRAIHLYQ